MGERIAWLGVAALLVAGGAAAVLWGFGLLPLSPSADEPERAERMKKPEEAPPDGAGVATFGNGCFWCTEAVFQQLKGVHKAVPGYSGGDVKDPTYEQVCRGNTGHAEAIRITFDPKVITYVDLLEVFWKTHDPTTLNRQGADVGTQYRSVIFYHSWEQKVQAERYKKKLDASGAFSRPIVTQIVPAAEFYPAEQYHHDFFVNNPDQRYCRAVIVPKLKKFEEAFADKLKPAAPK